MATRRIFLKNSALAMVGIGVLPKWLARSAYASEVGGKKKILVAIFQRGAADGLNVVVPYGEEAYYKLRPSISVPRAQLLDLDGFFGFHPSLAALKPLWTQGHLAAIHATGSPDPSRSHFDAQDFMESGTPGVKSTDDGWLNRAIGLDPLAGTSPMRAVAMGAQVPLTLQGHVPAVAINNLNAFRVGGASPQAALVGSTFESMYDQAADAVLRPAGQDTFEALHLVQKLDPKTYRPENGAVYPNQALGNSLRQLAQLIKADVGVEVAFADVGGWDHHVNEGSVQGQLANNLRGFGDAIAAFWTDLGSRQEDVVLVTMSEFGRTVHENGNRGTDHGHANVMFALGGAVRGGKVYGDWPGLKSNQLYQDRDLAVTTDFRDVLCEVVARHLGVAQLSGVFPGYAAAPGRFRGFLRS
ncbi:MAG TPA: DUF1501 domain-containing protein [Terriglobales bacterium]|nr:DUF1501 domain-containing protein [Terriglobales bacterium]